MNINRVLVANRGAIAVRIIRTLSKMGIESVAVYHSDEADAGYVALATYAIDLGRGDLSGTFLNIEKLVSIAENYTCDAIHPGYGFLSENYLFAKACEESKIKFIGPTSSVIRLMGLKSKAKEIAIDAKVPVLQSKAIAKAEEFNENEYQFPLLIKAIAGGGGKGLKVVRRKEDISDAISSAKREALQYFNNDKLIIEPYVENARHIEVQILGNEHGEIIHLFERECSIQRNHQKIIEEAPAPGLKEDVREKLYAAAVRYAAQLQYTGVGTVEFLVSGENFWFLEMNTRIQVEHAVTELITGTDIVAEQIKIIQGKHFSKELKKSKVSGHSIETRIYAENPYAEFRPSAGEIQFLNLPTKVRFDTFIEQGTKITSHFDSLLGKLIVWSENRKDAIELIKSKLAETKILGIKTNISYLNHLLRYTDYTENRITTTFIEKHHDSIVNDAEEGRKNFSRELLIASFLYEYFIKKDTPTKNIWQQVGTNNLHRQLIVSVDDIRHNVVISSLKSRSFSYLLKGKSVEVEIIKTKQNQHALKINGQIKQCFFTSSQAKTLENKQKAETGEFELFASGSYVYRLSSSNILQMASHFMHHETGNEQEEFNQIRSPLFGKVISIKAEKNKTVSKGEVLLTIESMKTENNILSPINGIVEEILCKEGEQVKENSLLIKINIRE